MIKNLIFDFGNVIAKYNPYEITGLYVNDDEKRKLLTELVFGDEHWKKLDSGMVTDEEYKKELSGRTPDELRETALFIFDRWIASMPPVENMEKLILDLSKTNIKLYLLSNISIGFSEKYHTVEWIKNVLSYFDGLVFSGVVKITKPGREIFEHILKTYNLIPEECLFIDDLEKNIKGAEDVGIQGYLFDGDAEKLRKYLESDGKVG